MAQEQKNIKGCVTLKNIGICYGDKNIFENLNLRNSLEFNTKIIICHLKLFYKLQIS